MTTWQQDLQNITVDARSHPGAWKVATGQRRHAYLKALRCHTGRNVVAYYGGILFDPQMAAFIQERPDMAPYLQNPDVLAALGKGLLGLPIPRVEGIRIPDVLQLRVVVSRLDPSLGLDLLLHTTGGHAQSTLQMMCDLRARFGPNLRVIVPELAASAGTLLACAARTIVLARTAALGHIRSDPVLFNAGKTHLRTGMFLEAGDTEGIAAGIMRALTDPTRPHDRLFLFEECIQVGLKIEPLEDGETSYDLVASAHAAIQHHLIYTPASKLIENHEGMGFVQACDERSSDCSSYFGRPIR